jgi:hypothetical protein
MSESKDMVILLWLSLCWTTYTNLNSYVFDQILHGLNPRPKTYNQTCFETEFANTKNLTECFLCEGIIDGLWLLSLVLVSVSNDHFAMIGILDMSIVWAR